MPTKAEIKEACENAGIKQQELADYMGVSIGAVRIWMQDTAPARLTPRVANDERIQALVYGDGRFVKLTPKERVRDAIYKGGCGTIEDVERFVNNRCRLIIEARTKVRMTTIEEICSRLEDEHN